MSSFIFNVYALDDMAFTRGSKDDYDRWARVTDDKGWSWDSLFPYMLKVNLHHILSLLFIMTISDGKTYPPPRPSEYNRRYRPEAAWKVWCAPLSDDGLRPDLTMYRACGH